MADGRRRKGSAKHAGVVFQHRTWKRQDGTRGDAWRARFVDPDEKAKHPNDPAKWLVWETLGDDDAKDEKTRTAWALAKVETLRDDTKAIATGERPVKKGGTLEAAVATFLADNATLREKTLRGYRDATTTMVEWARGVGVVLGDDLKGEHLAALHSFLKTKKRRQPAKKGERYAQTEGKRFRSAHTVNRELRAIKTCLEHLRRLGLVPMLTRDKIEDNLKNLEKPVEEPEPISESDLLKIIAAAKRHDEEIGKRPARRATLMRDEDDEKPEAGAPRFSPVLRYFAFLLLTGMREGEGRSLRWERVDLTARPAGTIKLTSEDTKTHRGRTLDLGVSPLLRELLAVLKLQAGDATFVFGDAIDPKTNETVPALTRETVEAGRRRLVGEDFGAPHFTWQQCRVTCACYLVNAPGIFGTGVSHFRESKQLGHSVQVAERHYTGVVHVAPEAKTLEGAMGIETKLREALGLTALAAKNAASG